MGCGGRSSLVDPRPLASGGSSTGGGVPADGGSDAADAADAADASLAPTPSCKGANSQCVLTDGRDNAGSSIIHCDPVYFVGPWNLLLEREINAQFKVVETRAVLEPGTGTTFYDMSRAAGPAHLPGVRGRRPRVRAAWRGPSPTLRPGRLRVRAVHLSRAPGVRGLHRQRLRAQRLLRRVPEQRSLQRRPALVLSGGHGVRRFRRVRVRAAQALPRLRVLERAPLRLRDRQLTKGPLAAPSRQGR